MFRQLKTAQSSLKNYAKSPQTSKTSRQPSQDVLFNTDLNRSHRQDVGWFSAEFKSCLIGKLSNS
jgi:hypothetical protein